MADAEKDFDEAIIELAAAALKAGVPTDVIADKLIRFGTLYRVVSDRDPNLALPYSGL